MKVREQLIGLCAVAVVAVSAASALEVSEAPAPEFKSYARENAIDPSADGVAKELSDQAKVIAELGEEVEAVRAQRCVLDSKYASLEQRIDVLEQKVSRIVRILKLKLENGK